MKLKLVRHIYVRKIYKNARLNEIEHVIKYVAKLSVY